jgi:hypothetical protein
MALLVGIISGIACAYVVSGEVWGRPGLRGLLVELLLYFFFWHVSNFGDSTHVILGWPTARTYLVSLLLGIWELG